MYNEPQKIRYITNAENAYVDSYVKNLYSLFNKTQRAEELFEKDVSNFSYLEISEMYSMFTYADEFVFSNVNSRLASYCDWCNANNLVVDGCNHFKEFTMEDLRRYIDKRLEGKKYLSREDMLGFVQGIFNPRDQFLLLAIFELGKSNHFMDILEMKMSDIDEKTKTVVLSHSGRKVSLSQELIDYAKESDQQDRYYFAISERSKPLVKSEFIFKKVIGRSDTCDPLSCNKLVAKIIKDIVDLHGKYVGINASSLAVSGQMEMIRRRAKELGIEQEKYVLEYFDELRAQYEMSPNSPQSFLKKYGAYI